MLQALFNVMFVGDYYDMAVGSKSAIAVSSKNQGYIGAKNYNHMSICLQDNIRERVLELLKGSESNFDIFGVLSFPVSSIDNASVVISKEKFTLAEESNNQLSEYFVEHFVLSSDIEVFSIDDIKTVNLVISPDTAIVNNVYVTAEFETRSKIYKTISNDTGKFTAMLTFTSQDIGIIDVSCFSQGNEDNVYVSNTVKLIIEPNIDLWESTDTILEFLNTPNITYTDSSITNDVMIQYKQITLPGILYTNVSSDVPAELYLTTSTSSGNVYNVSFPSMGTEWTSDDIAMVTNEGRVRGLKEGITTLTAYYEGLTASISVDVGPEYVYISSEDEVIEDETIQDEAISDNDESNSTRENNSLGHASSSCNTSILSINLLAVLFVIKSHKRMS